MAAVRDMLSGAGFDMSRYHEESFNFEELSTGGERAAAIRHRAEPPPAPDREDLPGRVRQDAAASIECAADNMSVLEAARKAGMRLPSSCTKGLCGTCK